MQTKIIGHRGASYDAPENTLASVNLAWAQDADAVEIDVWLSKDDAIVAIHDGNTKRLTGCDRRIRDQTLQELKSLDVGCWKGTQWQGEPIPELTEVLETIPRGKRLLIEIKCGSEIVEPLTSTLRAYSGFPDHVTVIGYSQLTMRKVKQRLPTMNVYLVAKRVHCGNGNDGKPETRILVDLALKAGLDGLDLNNGPGISSDSAQMVKDAGLDLYFWNVNTVEDALRLTQAGADALTTDRPGWLRSEMEHLLSPSLGQQLRCLPQGIYTAHGQD